MYTFVLESDRILRAVSEQEEPGTTEKTSKNIATEEEVSRAKSYYNGILEDVSSFPVSFKIGEISYNGFNEDFQKSSVSVQDDADTSVSLIKTELTHKSGLVFTIESVLYEKYAAYEWVIRITNPTDQDSPVISELKSLDADFVGAEPTLYHTEGDVAQFLPQVSKLSGHLAYAPDNGRSSGGEFPYYRFEYGEHGIMLAIGWAGQWSASFDNSDNAAVTNITAGQETFQSYLKAGETVRTPTISIVNYDGREDADRATNLWRRWYIDNIMIRVQDESGERVLFEPQIGAHVAPDVSEEVLASEENLMEVVQFLAESDIDLTFFWVDAGWYYNVGDQYIGSSNISWRQVGTWIMDAERFPTRMKALSDLCAEYGIRTLLWFEPERVAVDLGGLEADERLIDPEWVIDGNFLDLGNPDAVKFITEHVISVMKEGGVSLYREDFNIDPLPFWTSADAEQGENRQGITENKHIQGHFRYWDAIIAEFPETPIDACASGGLRLDLDTMRYAVSLHRTDYNYTDNLANQCYSLEMFKWLPYFSAAIGNYSADKFALRMALTPWMRIPTYAYSAQYDLDIIKDAIEEHHRVDEYFYADYYDLFGYARAASAWTGWEFFDEKAESGYAIVFRNSNAVATKTVHLKGLDEDTVYNLRFEDRGMELQATGSSLMDEGITVTLPAGETSDIIYISAAPFEARALEARVTRTAQDGLYGGAVDAVPGYNRFDIRFNMALRGTVFSNSTQTVETFTDQSLMEQISLNGVTLSKLEAGAERNIRLEYDVVNNILRVYVRDGAVDFGQNVTLLLTQELQTFSGVSLAEEAKFVYDAAVDAWAEGDVKAEPYEDLDFEVWPAEELFGSIYDLSEEDISFINMISPWEIYETGISAWVYGTEDKSGPYGVYTVTQAEEAQYAATGHQAICIDYSKMKSPGDYYLDFGLVGVEPGTIVTISFMAKADAESLDGMFFQLRNENNAEGGDLGNYVVKGKLVKGEWVPFTLQFVATPTEKGINLAKIAASRGGENTGGKVYIDAISVTAERADTELLDGYGFEEEIDEGKIGYIKPWEAEPAAPAEIGTWNYGVSDSAVFSVESDPLNAGNKIIAAQLDASMMQTRSTDSGYFLDFYFSGLEQNGIYYLNFKVKSEDLDNLKLYAMTERNFGKESEGKYGKTVSVTGEMYEIIAGSEWTDAKIAFVAKPDSTGVCCLRLSISPTVFKSYTGQFFFDAFSLEKSLLDEEEFGTLPEITPYSLPEDFDGTFVTWTYSVTGITKIFTYDSETNDGAGRSILADLTYVTSVSEIEGHGYFLDYYLYDLQPGAIYTLAFLYKTEELHDAILLVDNEANYGNTVSMAEVRCGASAEWKMVKANFTAVEDVNGRYCLRFAIYPTAGQTGAGKLWIDAIAVEEYDESKDGSYAEDKQSGASASAPWELPENYAGGFAWWQNEVGGSVTIEGDYLEIMGGVGKSLKVSLDEAVAANVSWGGYYLDYYIAGLTEGMDYELSFYLKADAVVLDAITVEYEANYYPNNNPGYTMQGVRITEFPGDWTHISVVFTAALADNDLCAIRIGFYPGTGGAPGGTVWLDQFATEEYSLAGDYAEDGLTGVIAAAPWELPSDYSGGLALWQNEVGGSANVSLDTEDIMAETGKSVKVDLSAAQNAAVSWGGYFLDYYIAGLTAGQDYQFSFYIKADSVVLNNMTVEYEANFYPNSDPGYAMNVVQTTLFPAEWTRIDVVFKGAPGTNGLTAIRLGFYTGTDVQTPPSGTIRLDQLAVEKYEMEEGALEELQASINYTPPWEISADYTGGLAYWYTNGDRGPVFDSETRSGEGKSVAIDYSDAEATSGEIFLDLYVDGLETGKEYTLRFYYKVTENCNISCAVINEANYGQTLTIMNPTSGTEYRIAEYASEWTLAEVRFTAFPLETSGLCAVRWSFAVVPETTAAGIFYLDEITVQESAAV